MLVRCSGQGKLIGAIRRNGVESLRPFTPPCLIHRSVYFYNNDIQVVAGLSHHSTAFPYGGLASEHRAIRCFGRTTVSLRYLL